MAPVRVDRVRGPVVVPAEDHGVRAAWTPPAAVNRAPQRHVRRAVEEAATDDRGRGDDRDLVAGLGEIAGPSRARASRRGRRARARARPASARPSSTSWIDDDVGALRARQAIDHGAARAGTRSAAAARPVATTTSSAPAAATSAAVAAVPSRTSTPSAASRRPYHASRSPIWPRDGCRPASRNCPPSSVASLEERHAMAALGRDPGRLETRRPATDHQHAAAPSPPARTDRRPTRTRARPTGSRGTRSSSRASGDPSTSGCTRCTAGPRRRGRRGPWRPGAGRRSGRGRC